MKHGHQVETIRGNRIKSTSTIFLLSTPEPTLMRPPVYESHECGQATTCAYAPWNEVQKVEFAAEEWAGTRLLKVFTL